MNQKVFPYTLDFLRVRKELGELLASLLGEDSTRQGDLLGGLVSPLNQSSTPRGAKASAFHVTGSLLAKIVLWKSFTFSW